MPRREWLQEEDVQTGQMAAARRPIADDPRERSKSARAPAPRHPLPLPPAPIGRARAATSFARTSGNPPGRETRPGLCPPALARPASAPCLRRPPRPLARWRAAAPAPVSSNTPAPTGETGFSAWQTRVICYRDSLARLSAESRPRWTLNQAHFQATKNWAFAFARTCPGWVFDNALDSPSPMRKLGAASVPRPWRTPAIGNKYVGRGAGTCARVVARAVMPAAPRFVSAFPPTQAHWP